MKAIIRILLVLSVIALFAAACAPNSPTAQPESAPVESAASEPVSEPPAATEPPGEPEAAVPTDAEPTGAAPPTDTQAAPTDAPVEVAEECPYSPELHATNPATVSLASGEVQLVEFFAFW